MDQRKFDLRTSGLGTQLLGLVDSPVVK